MNRSVAKMAALAVAILAACMQRVHAVAQISQDGCGALNRNIDFWDSAPGPYTDDDLQNDFDGYRYFKRREMASIVEIDDTKYLDVKLHGGCVGTVGDKGCGLQGALPLFGVGSSATLEYTVRFSDGYDFRRGGKLMGLCSGQCKSGCHSTADLGASLRIMWGPEGSLYLYTYTYSGSSKTCGMNTKPTTPVKLLPGRDYRIRLTVKMNDPGQDNGVVSLYVDGEYIVSAEGLRMRNSIEQVIDSLVFHTFFGGSGKDWAAAKDEHIFFKSIKVWDGDCGGHSGELALAETAKWEPQANMAGPEGSWALSLDTSIYGSWNGRFCLWYEVTNNGDSTCDRFVLMSSVNKSVGTLASHKNLVVMEQDEEAGFFMFTREQDKHAKLKPGKSRKGNVCFESPKNIKQSFGRIASNYLFTAHCQG